MAKEDETAGVLPPPGVSYSVIGMRSSSITLHFGGGYNIVGFSMTHMLPGRHGRDSSLVLCCFG